MWSVRYVHKIAPSDKDVGPSFNLKPGALENARTLGFALREARVLARGFRLRAFRVENAGNRIVAFPAGGSWHSIILEREGS